MIVNMIKKGSLAKAPLYPVRPNSKVYFAINFRPAYSAYAMATVR
jgi:hypothetical protein